jgi:hypothetical protein
MPDLPDNDPPPELSEEQIDFMVRAMQAASDRRCAAAPGGKDHFRCLIQEAILKIEFDSFHSGPAPWQLFYDRELVRNFPTETDAMIAVATRNTTDPRIDNYRGTPALPVNDSDWE